MHLPSDRGDDGSAGLPDVHTSIGRAKCWRAPADSGVAPTRWPLYEKQCSDWTTALEEIRGEFGHTAFKDGLIAGSAIVLAASGAWLLFAKLMEPDRFVPSYQ